MKRYERSYIWFSLAVIRLKYILYENEKIRAISVTSPFSLALRLFICYFIFCVFALGYHIPANTIPEILLLPFNPAYSNDLLLSRILFFVTFSIWMYQLLGRKIVITDNRLIILNLITGYSSSFPITKTILFEHGRFGRMLFYRNALIIDNSDRFLRFKGIINYNAIYEAQKASIENSSSIKKQEEGYFRDYKAKKLRNAEVKKSGIIYYIGNEYKTRRNSLEREIKEIMDRYDNKAAYLPLFHFVTDIPSIKNLVMCLYIAFYISPNVWKDSREVLREYTVSSSKGHYNISKDRMSTRMNCINKTETYSNTKTSDDGEHSKGVNVSYELTGASKNASVESDNYNVLGLGDSIDGSIEPANRYSGSLKQDEKFITEGLQSHLQLTNPENKVIKVEFNKATLR